MDAEFYSRENQVAYGQYLYLSVRIRIHFRFTPLTASASNGLSGQ